MLNKIRINYNDGAYIHLIFSVAEPVKEQSIDYSNRCKMELTEKYSSDIISQLESALNSQDDRVKKSKDKKLDSKNLSKLQVDQILDSANIKTMDGCLKILAELHVSEALEESE